MSGEEGYSSRDVYDKSSILYDPEGRLRQIDNAEKSANLSPMCMGMKYKDGVILAARKFTNEKEKVEGIELIEAESIEKIYKIDDNLALTYAGFPPDVRKLVELAREYAQFYRMQNDEPLSAKELADYVGSYEHQFTQIAGYRPFGVCIFFAGIDDDGSMHLYENEPHGGHVEQKASFLGEPLKALNRNSEEKPIRKLLSEKYDEGMEYLEAKKLVLRCLIKSYDENLDHSPEVAGKRIEMAVIRIENKKIKFERVSSAELKDTLEELEHELVSEG